MKKLVGAALRGGQEVKPSDQMGSREPGPSWLAPLPKKTCTRGMLCAKSARATFTFAALVKGTGGGVSAGAPTAAL